MIKRKKRKQFTLIELEKSKTSRPLKSKRYFTLIELIIVIVVIGILAGMTLPKFTGVVKNSKVAAMITDIDTLEKAIMMYQQDNDTLPLFEETKTFGLQRLTENDMADIYPSLQEALKLSEDSEEYLYKINLDESSKYHSKTKYGHGKTDKDFYVYSTKSNEVYYYGYLKDGDDKYNHNENPIIIESNELVKKIPSIDLNNPTNDNPTNENKISQDLLFVTSNGSSGGCEVLATFKKDGTIEDTLLNESRNYIYIEIPKSEEDLQLLKEKSIQFDLFIPSPSYGIFLKRNIKNSSYETFGPDKTHTYTLSLSDILDNSIKFNQYSDKKFMKIVQITGNGSGTPQISNFKLID